MENKKTMKLLRERKNETLLLSNFEDLIESAVIIHYNEDTIEIPNAVILKKGDGSFLIEKVMNASLEVINIEDHIFDAMYEAITASEVENRMIFKANLSPDFTVSVNLDRLRETAVYVKETDTAVFVNNIVFTNSKLEFHGEGMFTMRNAYLIKDISIIKNQFKY